jgi:signal transduction histidine kinase
MELSYSSKLTRIDAGGQGRPVGGNQVAYGTGAGWQSPSGIPKWMSFGASLFVTGVVVTALVVGQSTLPLPVQLLLAGLALLPWLPGSHVRLSSPMFVFLSTVPTALLVWTGGSPVLFAALALSAARVAVSTTIPKSALYGVLAVGVIVGRQYVAHIPTSWWMWKTYVELAIVAGIAFQRQRMLIHQTRQASAEHARAAGLEERRRIALDVHDVLAHTLTILMVHVQSARLSVQDDPHATAEILDEVAEHGRHCLDEIRRTVGLSSDPGTVEPVTGPIETATAIEELAASYRKAGVDVDLRLDVEMEHMGRLALAPADVWASAYRVVQEAMANAAKHAPGSPMTVWIGVDDPGLHITCTNECTPGVVMLELPKGGNGIPGMRERVDRVGGTIRAGHEGKSWVVRADLPLAQEGEGADAAPADMGRAS